MTFRQAAWLLGWLSLAVCTASAADLASAVSEVRAEGQRLTVQADRVALRDLCATLAQRGIATVNVQGDASGILVSDSFEASDAAQVLRRVLSAHSHILIDRGTPAGGLRLIEVILLGSRASPGTDKAHIPIRLEAAGDRAVAPGHESQLESSAETLVYEALSSASAAERAAAVDAIAYRDPAADGPESRADAVLLSALSDPVDEVRAQAISTLKDTADEIPFDALSQVAREDEQAAIRIQALELLVERGEARALAPLRIALLDSEDAVRTRARELIDEWHLDAGRADSP